VLPAIEASARVSQASNTGSTFTSDTDGNQVEIPPDTGVVILCGNDSDVVAGLRAVVKGPVMIKEQAGIFASLDGMTSDRWLKETFHRRQYPVPIQQKCKHSPPRQTLSALYHYLRL
jgi:hypothetical protein